MIPQIWLILHHYQVSIQHYVLKFQEVYLLIQVNYLGNVYCCHYALPHLLKAQGQIICISSLQGKITAPFHSGYSPSKHALQGFYDGLRMELGKKINILMVYPTWIHGTALRDRAFCIHAAQKPSSRSKHLLTLELCTQKIIMAIRKKKQELTLPNNKVSFLLKFITTYRI